MNTESIIALVFAILLTLGGGYLYYSRLVVFNRASPVVSFRKKPLLLALSGAFALGLGFLLLALTAFLASPGWAGITAFPTESVFAGRSVNYALYLSSALIGAFVFGVTATLLNGAMVVLVKKEKLDGENKKLVKTVLYCSIPLAVFSFVLATSGFGPYLEYPLVNGIGFGNEGVYWLRVGESHDGLHITWYALCYLIGVAICYVICDHKMYKRYGRHGIIDTLVLVAFPAGIIGARIWYVVGNFEREFAGRPWYSVFEIWNGGLTILGGAAVGIVVGFIFMRLRRKYVDPRWAVDVIVPTILLAQFVGRWGNFFNCEVYGQAVSVEGWSFLPNWLLEQMHVSNGGSLLPAGEIYVPLFLIEGVINLVGYFVISKGLPALFGKRLVPGDLGGAYFIWYGIVRMIMEPMRDTNFNMGTDDAWSVVNSMAYVFIGLAVVLLLHLHDDYLRRRDPLPSAVAAFALAFLSFFAPLLPSINLVDGSEVIPMGGYEAIGSGEAPLFLAALVLLAMSGVILLAVLLLSILRRKGKFAYSLSFPWLTLGRGKGRPETFDFESLLFLSAIPFLALAALFFFIGTGTLGPSFFVGEGSSVNLSYGFSLAAIFLIIAALLPLTVLLARYGANRLEKREGEIAEAGV